MKRPKNRLTCFLLAFGFIATACLLAGGGYLIVRRALPPLIARWRDAARPIVAIFAPHHGEQVIVNSTITVQAEGAARGSQVVLLQLWADGTLVGEQSGAAERLSTSWSWLPLTPGDHTLLVRAYNARHDAGVAMVRVTAIEAADADRDGIPDQTDECPDHPGLLQLEGCPPGLADGGDANNPDSQEVGNSWVSGGDELGDSEVLSEEEAVDSEAAEEEAPHTVGEPGTIQGNQGRPGFEEADHFPGQVAIERNCMICDWLDEQAGDQVYEDAQAEPGVGLEVEVLNLRTAEGLSNVACYARLQSSQWERVPADQNEFFAPSGGGFWNIADYMGGEQGQGVTVPPGEPLRMQIHCLGRLGDLLSPSLHLGEVSREHGPADWNGQTFTARGQQGANWFDVSYRICSIPCEEGVIPPPYRLSIRRNVGAVTTFTLSWRWDGDPATIQGFNVYRDGALIDFTPNKFTFLSENTAVPECSLEYRFEVRAVTTTHEESAPSNPAFSAAYQSCRGRNELEIANVNLPTPRRSHLTIELNYWYNGERGNQVHVLALPLQGNAPPGWPNLFHENFSITSATIQPDLGNTFVHVYYGGDEQLITDGLRLVMMDNNNQWFYTRDVPLEVLWYPSGADLQITEADMLHMAGNLHIPTIVVRNNGYRRLWWHPDILASRQDGSEILHMRDQQGTYVLGPNESVLISWPTWNQDMMAALTPAYQLMVDADNSIAELNEANNTYSGSLRRLRVTFGQITTGHSGELTAGPSQYYVGLGGNFQVGHPGMTLGSLNFRGGAHDEWVDNLGENDLFECHEEGLTVNDDYSFATSEAFRVIRACSPILRSLGGSGYSGLIIFRTGAVPPSGQMSEHDMNEWCQHLSQQGYTPENNNLVVTVQPDQPLNISAYLYDLDVEYNFWAVSCRDDYEHICRVTQTISLDQLQHLPLDINLGTVSGDGCRIEVHIEELPSP